MWEKLKKRWKIKSNFQVVVILIVFSLTGSATLVVKKYIFNWLGITSDTGLWIKIPLYIVTIVPVYQVMFIIVGTIFGQFRFAWEFEKKMLSRFKRKRKIK